MAGPTLARIVDEVGYGHPTKIRRLVTPSPKVVVIATLPDQDAESGEVFEYIQTRLLNLLFIAHMKAVAAQTGIYISRFTGFREEAGPFWYRNLENCTASYHRSSDFLLKQRYCIVDVRH